MKQTSAQKNPCEVCGKAVSSGILCDPCRDRATEHWQIIRAQMKRDGIASGEEGEQKEVCV
jgi:hypothetical protein